MLNTYKQNLRTSNQTKRKKYLNQVRLKQYSHRCTRFWKSGGSSKPKFLGAHYFDFYCIFITKFFENLYRGAFCQTPLPPISPFSPSLCISVLWFNCTVCKSLRFLMLVTFRASKIFLICPAICLIEIGSVSFASCVSVPKQKIYQKSSNNLKSKNICKYYSRNWNFVKVIEVHFEALDIEQNYM